MPSPKAPTSKSSSKKDKALLTKIEVLERKQELEAALERVRAASMAMHDSSELSKVAKVLNDEFSKLKIRGYSGVSLLLFEENGTTTMWDFSDPGNMGKPDHKVATWEPKKYPQLGETWKKWKEKKEYFTIEYDSEKVKKGLEEWKQINSDVYKALKGPFDKGLIDTQWNAFGKFSSGLLTLDLLNPPDDEIRVITIKMANAFGLAYQRFLDLQKAEEQARKANIEAALERVRTRTMAMQSSDELSEASFLLDQEVRNLGIKTWGCAFNIYREKDSIEWFGNEKGVLPTYTIPRKGIFKKYYDLGQKGSSIHVQEFKGQKCIEHYEYMSTLPVIGDVLKKLKESNGSFPEYQIDHVVYFKYGYLLFITIESVLESHNIFMRFAKVFEQTYTRFLDLKKAEEQAREAQIELALERIRAQATAMKESSDLQDIVVAMRKEFVNLGYEANYFWHMRWLPDRYEKAMTAGDGARIGMVMKLPRHIHGDVPLVAKWEKKKDPTLVFPMDAETAVTYVDKMISLGDFEQLDPNAPSLEDVRNLGGLTFIMARTTHGEIGYSLPGNIHEPPKEGIETLRRFASAFDLAYKRFEDLKQAEQQAREVKVEAALERARAQSMMMQHSDEIDNVSNVFHEQITFLDIPSEFSYVWLPDEENQSHQFWASWHEEKGKKRALESKQITYPLDKSEPYTAACFKAWANPDVILEEFIKPSDVVGFFDVWHELLDGAQNLKSNYFPDGLYYSEAYMRYGCFGINIRRKLSADEKAILKRFSIEFERAYTRFLDLKKAEAQAREAQIEAAVERVRAEAMAMHLPSDLVKVTQTLIMEITNLGIEGITGAAFILIDENDIVTMWDISDPGNMGYTRDHKSTYDPKEFNMLGEFWRKWKNGQEYFVIEYDLEKNKKELEEWKLVDEENYLNLKRAIENNKLKTQWNPFGSFSSGLLTLDMLTEPDEDTELIVIKMARTFDLAYQRFDDLQKAAEQATEARKQASLDRIRAEIASMRNQTDLEKLTPFIWTELSSLGISFFRCGIFIMNEQSKKINMYLSTPKGESIATVTLDFDNSDITLAASQHWKNQHIFREKWDKDQFIEWSKGLEDQGLVISSESYQHSETPPEQLCLQFVPFKQGMLYVGTQDFLIENDLDLVQDVADAFSIAYTRYEDFVQLEKAKRMAEDALGELRSTQSQLVHAEKMASLGELTAGIAHEIQNPLNFVNNFSDLNTELVEELREALDSGDTEEAKAILNDLKSNEEKIIHHGRRAEGIVKGMLQHSRGGDGKKELTDINTLADEFLRLSYHGLRAKDKSFNAKFKCTLDENLPKIEVLSQDIGRVFLNLINNAFHATAEQSKKDASYKPTVEVVTQKEEDHIKIQVKDNGAGIPDKIKDKIFQPFFTTKATGTGTGLGLSLSHDIISKGHGGTIELESEIGKGTTFTIRLPIHAS
ncbi:sensor histidine kinase [Ekhidna sp.]|uniref:sensor histidine kinase n=1 Tax=Ekhidna sp. TaxID=2608089 RepID=UPI003B500F94